MPGVRSDTHQCGFTLRRVRHQQSRQHASRGAGYRYVECVTDNLDVIAARLRTRTAYSTQYRQERIDGMERPADRSVALRVDTSRPTGECAADILRFLQAGTAA